MKIVYLHGVGKNGDADGRWLTALNSGLSGIGAKPVSADDVIAPRYAALLGAKPGKTPHPDVTYKVKNDPDARRVFERRQAGVERIINSQFSNCRTFGFELAPNTVVNAVQHVALENPPIYELRQVRNYLDEDATQSAVLQHILDQLPTKGEIILIGHSLGSVISIDLLDHLPNKLHVRRFITIGSPAGSPLLHQKSDRLLKRFPFSRVDDWSNFFDPRDPVTAGRGLAALFPGAQDFAITGAAKHRSELYLHNPAIATLVGQTLYPAKDLVVSNAGLTVRLTDNEATSLATLEFAHQVTGRLSTKNDALPRFEAAIDVLRDKFVDEQIQQRAGQPLPPEIETLKSGRMPTLPRRWDLSQAVAITVVLANTNLVAPYEIDVDDAAVEAIPSFLQALGYTASIGDKVKKAVVEVNDHLSQSRWSPSTKARIALAATGVAILAAGPIGVALAGASGVAGAAAITSGLAAFGPGGMAGGIAMVSGLSGTGGMVAAAAASARQGSPTMVLDPSSLAIQVATAQASKAVGEQYDTNLWFELCQAETQIAVRYNRLVTFSDEKSPELVKLQTARETITGLQEYMRKKGLVPDELTPALTDAASPGAPTNNRAVGAIKRLGR